MIISKTPYRVSFVGGGTDIKKYYDTGYGAVVSMAISKYLYVTVNKKFEPGIRVAYTETENVSRVSELKHNIIRSCMLDAGIDEGIEITTIGEVPGGTGLGSSSTLTVGVLNALYAYKGIGLSADELMKKACEIEINILKAPIGKQDQCAAAYGGLNYFRFNPDETVYRERLWLSDADMRSLAGKLLMFYVGSRQNANEILREQTEKTVQNLSTLDEMRSQADALRKILTKGDPGDELGRMLHEGWIRKKTIAGGITSGRIDELYAIALKAGATGGKLLGAGGGGFLLLYCNEDKQAALRKALGLREMVFHLANYGSRIIGMD